MWMGAELTLPRRVLTVDDYHRMGEVGLLRPDERIELIHGDLITMAPIGGPHLHLVSVISQLLTMAVGKSAFVSVQNPISLPPDSEPQPDIALLRSELWHRVAVPTARDVLLVIEVADSTLGHDRGIKIPLYARHGIPEAWLFDVNSQRTTLYRDPTPDGYRTVLSPDAASSISPLLRPDVVVSLAEIWASTGG
jgi:Uma2 family endonuclease